MKIINMIVVVTEIDGLITVYYIIVNVQYNSGYSSTNTELLDVDTGIIVL